MTVPANQRAPFPAAPFGSHLFTETAVIDSIILSSIDHAVNLRPALPENIGAYPPLAARSPAKRGEDRADGRWPAPH
jgi:hypothetical protein